MEPSMSIQEDTTHMATTAEIIQTLRALQEQVLRLQERQEETFRGIETNRVGMRERMEIQEENRTAPSTTVKATTGPKPSPPADFDGERAKGRPFLNSVKWYMRSRGSEFRDDAHRIAWTLSFMKGGRALTFVNQVTRHTEIEGMLPYEDWTVFWKELEDRFLPLDESEEAMNLLETEKYFQGRRTVDDYCDQFQDLVDHAGYGEGKQVVMKFRKGLEATIADAVATMKEGRPKDDDLKAWIRTAKDIARERVRNDAFNTAARKDKYIPKTITNTNFKTSNPMRGILPVPSLPAFTPNRNPSTPIARPQHNTESYVAPLKPKNDIPVPMEVDASKQKGRFPVVCHRCGQAGHYKHQCPLRYDVRYMSSEELEDCLQDQLTREDTAEVARTGIEGEKESEPVEAMPERHFQESDE
jgi:hypothetical protein